ncbi:response regulator [Methylocapsa polymorpha]|uniref:Response regulator n=1 Tax=Methylocapsa polymorpha TaxID=3080828 RepID=A0ABZ0HS59_9HYPH|nr:response regulator [Methylocapsa sp. RX1]
MPVVLVVEDEPFVRMMGADVLEHAGFGVIEACNADEALRVLEVRPDVRVVFTDVEMPGSLDGLALARRVHDCWPRIGVVVTSGRGHVDEESMPNDDPFVSKPYAPKVLVLRIEEAMQRGRSDNDDP